MKVSRRDIRGRVCYQYLSNVSIIEREREKDTERRRRREGESKGGRERDRERQKERKRELSEMGGAADRERLHEG
jgi:hypothetical protein